MPSRWSGAFLPTRGAMPAGASPRCGSCHFKSLSWPSPPTPSLDCPPPSGMGGVACSRAVWRGK